MESAAHSDIARHKTGIVVREREREKGWEREWEKGWERKCPSNILRNLKVFQSIAINHLHSYQISFVLLLAMYTPHHSLELNDQRTKANILQEEYADPPCVALA